MIDFRNSTASAHAIRISGAEPVRRRSRCGTGRRAVRAGPARCGTAPGGEADSPSRTASHRPYRVFPVREQTVYPQRPRFRDARYTLRYAYIRQDRKDSARRFAGVSGSGPVESGGSWRRGHTAAICPGREVRRVVTLGQGGRRYRRIELRT